ncbi:4Fe-4S binding domain protein [[Clostridium] bifermentans ATCC 19299]|uniref:nitroreductase family protein n=1 Tax=Paraclostridium bifermentans TaxID=1490 RepID=UPI00038D3EF8|nr:nitroreductase family protein [Paraclostridium bifermentans]EQK41770.1 4Fe-4S binding domain protein [[Clostridium] bifermentans ATCC 19299] [Paraclostridium bifermentans ATCC 19299]
MMKVDKDLCIGCSLCVKDCIVNDIELVDGKAQIKNVSCFKCGHCIAICPKNAVSTDDYNMDEVLNYDKDSFTINEDNLLNFIKFRRSVRHFKKQDVEIEKINKIIEAGRFTQTSTNSQNVSYVVVKDNIEKLKEMAFDSLYNLGTTLLENLNDETKPFERYAKMWINMYNAYKENPTGRDGLFFNAPAVILVVSDSPVNASLASSNMELMTNALGLGTFFSGFFIKAAQENKEIMKFLGLSENQHIVNCMIIGYPSVKYQRTVPRKDAVISWK